MESLLESIKFLKKVAIVHLISRTDNPNLSILHFP